MTEKWQKKNLRFYMKLDYPGIWQISHYIFGEGGNHLMLESQAGFEFWLWCLPAVWSLGSNLEFSRAAGSLSIKWE